MVIFQQKWTTKGSELSKKVTEGVIKLKNRKSGGKNNITNKLIKYGGPTLLGKRNYEIYGKDIWEQFSNNEYEHFDKIILKRRPKDTRKIQRY